jgi:hypothetical protein
MLHFCLEHPLHPGLLLLLLSFGPLDGRSVDLAMQTQFEGEHWSRCWMFPPMPPPPPLSWFILWDKVDVEIRCSTFSAAARGSKG